jgi:hypothetical protein
MPPKGEVKDTKMETELRRGGDSSLPEGMTQLQRTQAIYCGFGDRLQASDMCRGRLW